MGSSGPEDGEIDRKIAEAVRLLDSGALAILPTDTVYGICADVRRDEAVEAIYSAKGKGSDAPLQLLFGAAALVDSYAVLSSSARRLVEALGAGPWTIVTPAAEGWASP
ncbi:MAG: L-threonylcarbamoyladenylate synthase, partial [Tepidiformaceae bacterium]